MLIVTYVYHSHILTNRHIWTKPLQFYLLIITIVCEFPNAQKCYQKMIRFFQLHGIIFIKSMQFYDKKGDAYVRQIIQQGDGVFFQAG